MARFKKQLCKKRHDCINLVLVPYNKNRESETESVLQKCKIIQAQDLASKKNELSCRVTFLHDQLEKQRIGHFLANQCGDAIFSEVSYKFLKFVASDYPRIQDMQ